MTGTGRCAGLPLPLGANAVRRDLGAETIAAVCRDLKASIEFAFANRDESVGYAMKYGRGLDRARVDRFVGMYVNGFSLDYGPGGREAVRRLMAEGFEAGIIPEKVEVRFAR